MIKIKNNNLNKIEYGLKMLSKNQPIDLKWELAKYSKPFIIENEIIKSVIQEYVKEHGTKNDKEEIVLDNNDEGLLELLNKEVEIEAEYLDLKFLEKFNPTMENLLLLEEIIK